VSHNELSSCHVTPSEIKQNIQVDPHHLNYATEFCKRILYGASSAAVGKCICNEQGMLSTYRLLGETNTSRLVSCPDIRAMNILNEIRQFLELEAQIHHHA
jgi:hypothetical protein